MLTWVVVSFERGHMNVLGLRLENEESQSFKEENRKRAATRLKEDEYIFGLRLQHEARKIPTSWQRTTPTKTGNEQLCFAGVQFSGKPAYTTGVAASTEGMLVSWMKKVQKCCVAWLRQFAAHFS